MPAVAKHQQGERVRELIENWARWPGWESGGSSRSTLAWLDDFVANKRVGDYEATIPVMGGDAADTHRALGRMPFHLCRVLVAHYTARGTVRVKVADLNQHVAAADRISKRTYFRYLDQAHPVFVEEFRVLREAAHHVETSNRRTPEVASTTVARRHRFLVSPKMGLLTPEKVRAINAEDESSEKGP